MRMLNAVLILLALVIGLLAGCTTAVILRHPQTRQTAQCGPYYSLGFYYWMATDRERTCVRDFQRQGYERAP